MVYIGKFNSKHLAFSLKKQEAPQIPAPRSPGNRRVSYLLPIDAPTKTQLKIVK